MYGKKGINAEMAFVAKRHVGAAPFLPKHGMMMDHKGLLGVMHNQETKRNYLEKTK
jgi:hypothetical protein